MSNGEFCCAIGLCCPPASAARRSALANELLHAAPAMGHEIASAAAGWLIENHEMVPKGVLVAGGPLHRSRGRLVLIASLAEGTDLPHEAVLPVADWIDEHVDLVPHGSVDLGILAAIVNGEHPGRIH